MLGACFSGAWVGRTWRYEPSGWSLLALSCGALWVYSLDHWADTSRERTSSGGSSDDWGSHLSARRAFYHRSRGQLLCLMAVATALGAWASAHLPSTTFIIGGACLVACGLYLWLAQRLLNTFAYGVKEMVIATLYAFALTLWPLSTWIIAEEPLPSGGVITSLMICCLAWSNLCLISAHERLDDIREGVTSLATQVGEEETRKHGLRGLYVALALWFLQLVNAQEIVVLPLTSPLGWCSLELLDQVISGLMIYTLWRLYRAPQWSEIDSRYRRWADLIFLYPALPFWISLLSKIFH